MRRYLIMVCVLVFAVAAHASAQQYQEVVYLKNGSIIRGVIIEQIPNESLKIQTQGGSVFVFKMSEVAKIVKEPAIAQSVLRASEKDPAVALLLSFVLVGAGQLYNEEQDKAYIHWLAAGVAIALLYMGVEDNDETVFRAGVLLGLGNWVYSMVDAATSAQKINEAKRRNRSLTLLDDRLFLEPYSSRKERGAMLSLRF